MGVVSAEVPDLAFVDISLFQRAQQAREHDRDIFETGGASTELYGRVKYLLGSRVKCPECNEKMFVGRNRYRCFSRTHNLGCTTSETFSVRVLERHAIDGLSSLLGPDFDAIYRDRLANSFVEHNRRIVADRLLIGAELEKLQQRYERGFKMSYEDSRLRGDHEQRLVALLDQMEDLRTRLRKLPAERFIPTLAENGLNTFRDQLADAKDRLPFKCVSAIDDQIMLNFRKIVVGVYPKAKAAGRLEVHIEYDLGPSFGVGPEIVGLDFECNEAEADPSPRGMQRRNVAKAVVESRHSLSDREYEVLRALDGVRRYLPGKEDRKRAMLDGLVASASEMVPPRFAMQAQGVALAVFDKYGLPFCSSVDALGEFANALTSLRPNGVHDFALLKIKRRPTRYLRSRLEAVEHPFLTLEFMHREPDDDTFEFSDVQWKAVLKALVKDRWEPLHYMLRGDMNVLVRAMIRNVMVGEVRGCTNAQALHGRLNRLMASGDFEKITLALLQLESRTVPVPITKIKMKKPAWKAPEKA